MADSKITALTSISTSTDPANDPLVIVDVSDTSMAATGTTKKVTLNQLLGASGTATLASATITGDLTVDTSTLKVDSVNNRVGIGTATPARPLDIVGSFQSSLGWVLTGTPAGLGAATRYIGGASTTDSWYYNAVTGGSHLWAFGESLAMTLNSTGLGVGKTPLARLDVASTRAASVIGGIVGTTGTGVVGDECQFLIKNVNTASGQNNGAGIGGLLEASASNKSSLLFYVDNGTAVTNVGRFDSNGNLLVGTTVSPSGTKIGSIAKLGKVNVEGTNTVTVSTSVVALARAFDTGGLFFISGYNTSGGTQGWWLVAARGGTVTTIASDNATGLTVAFTTPGSVLSMNTTSGTLSVSCISMTNQSV